jgi:hypothetical protein
MRALFVVKLDISSAIQAETVSATQQDIHLSDAICDAFSCSEQGIYYVNLKVQQEFSFFFFSISHSYAGKGKVKISLLLAMEAHRVVRG